MNPLLNQFSPINIPTLHDHPAVLSCRYDASGWTEGSAAKSGVVVPTELQGAIPKRLTEFVAGRVLARELLSAAGCVAPVGYRREQRYPVWPEGFTGSISHSQGVAVCAVADTARTLAVGLDVEHWMADATAASVGLRIATVGEVAALTQQGWPDVKALTVVFSAKEALFKALYPLSDTFFGFGDAQLCGAELADTHGILQFELLVDLASEITSGCRYQVHFQQYEDFVLTFAQLSR